MKKYLIPAAILVLLLGVLGGYIKLRARTSSMPILQLRILQEAQGSARGSVAGPRLHGQVSGAGPELFARGARALLAKLKQRAQSAPEFELEIARVSALADNAHSNVMGFLRAGKYPRLLIRTDSFWDRLYVVRAFTGFETSSVDESWPSTANRWRQWKWL